MTTSVRAARFWGVGALGFVVQMATLSGLADGLSVPIALATGAAVWAALVHNFIWHRLWTWADRRDGSVVGAFARFVAANGIVSLVGNVVITTALSGWLGLPALVANGVAVVACSVVNFLLGDTVVFKRTITPA
jgi:putative flippase GtrA